MQEIGIHPYDSEGVPNPYNQNTIERDFRNIGEHSFAVAAAARTLAQLLVQVGHLPIREWRRVVQRALLHDAIKPFEIMHGQPTGNEEEIEAARADLIHTLQHRSVPSYLVQLLCSAGKEAGHASLKNLVEVDEGGNLRLIKGALSEKLVHLCDCLTQSSIPTERLPAVTHFVTPAERIFEIGTRYNFMREGGLMLTAGGKIEAVAEINLVLRPNRRLGDYLEIQQFVAEEICKEFQQLLAPGGPANVSTEEAAEFMLHLLKLECLPGKAW